MNILIVNETSDLGGAETMAIELANALSAFSGNQIAFASAQGILIERLKKGVRFFPLVRYGVAKILKLFCQFRKIYLEIKPDVIHSQGGTIGLIAAVAAHVYYPRAKVVLTHHSVYFTRIPAWLGNFLLKLFVDACIAISTAKYVSFIKSGFKKKKVFLISNFIDREALLSQAAEENVKCLKTAIGVFSEERIVVGAGRLISEKRFDVFIDTLIHCAQLAPEIKILGLILGEGAQRQQLQDIADRIDLPNLRIKLLGFQRNVAVYLRMANIFLFPSEYYEVLPMCLIEAISLGVPVVCSDISGNNDIVEDGLNGFLVSTRKKDYSIFVLRLLRDKVLAREFSQNGIKKAQNSYDKEKVVRDILNLYNSMTRNDDEC